MGQEEENNNNNHHYAIGHQQQQQTCGPYMNNLIISRVERLSSEIKFNRVEPNLVGALSKQIVPPGQWPVMMYHRNNDHKRRQFYSK